MKLNKSIIAYLLTVAMIFVCIPASAYSPDRTMFDDFESYVGVVGSPWKSQGKALTTEIAYTEKGKSAKVISDSTKMQELLVDSTPLSDDETSVMFGFSMMLDGENVVRTIYSRNATKEYCIMTISADGTISAGNAVSTKLKMKKNQWYDFFVEYNIATGYIRCRINCDDGTETIEGIGPTGISGLYRLDFVSSQTIEEQAIMYIDDVWLEVADYEIVSMASNAENYEGYTASSRGKTAPDSTYAVAGFRSGYNGIYSATPVGSPNGRSICIECDSTSPVSAALYKYLNSGVPVPVSFNFDLCYSEISMGFTVRGTNANGSAINDRSVAIIDNDGNLRANASSAPICQLAKNTWYNIDISFSNESGCVITVTDSTGAKSTGSGGAYGGITSFTRVEFWAQKSDVNVQFYIDNLKIQTTGSGSVAGYSPVSVLDPKSPEISVLFNGNIDTNSLAGATVTINGDPSLISSITADNDILKIKLTSNVEYSSRYVLRFGGITAGGTQNLSGTNLYYSYKPFLIKDYAFVEPEVIPGVLNCNATIESKKGEIASAVMITRVYDKISGRMVSADICSGSLSATPLQFSTSVTVPDDGGEYYAVSSIWDSVTNMKSLMDYIILE